MISLRRSKIKIKLKKFMSRFVVPDCFANVPPFLEWVKLVVERTGSPKEDPTLQWFF